MLGLKSLITRILRRRGDGSQQMDREKDELKMGKGGRYLDRIDSLGGGS